MTLTRHLVIFAREPRLGRVKRRLASDLGALAAWRFHRLTTEALLRRLGPDPRWTCWLAVTPDSAARHGGPWGMACPGLARAIPQGPGNLGRRMARVLGVLPPGPVVIVGSDIPGITANHVAGAFRRLGDHDWVLGPATDGGYWLIGARRRPAFRLPFAGVRWGGPQALGDTLANLAGQEVAQVETLADVDRAEDLARLRGDQAAVHFSEHKPV